MTKINNLPTTFRRRAVRWGVALVVVLGGASAAAADLTITPPAAGDVVINTTSAGIASADGLDVRVEATPAAAVIMDMTYKPLLTPFLASLDLLGLVEVEDLWVAGVLGEGTQPVDHTAGQVAGRELRRHRECAERAGVVVEVALGLVPRHDLGLSAPRVDRDQDGRVRLGQRPVQLQRPLAR